METISTCKLGGNKVTFCLRSPSICHSDSDLSEGSRKYSPSSETSLETQRACGKAETRHFPHVHTHPDTYASKIMSVTSFMKPSLTKTEDYSSRQMWPFIPFPPPFLSLPKEAAALIYVFPVFVSCFVSSSHPPLSGGFSETYSALCDYNGISCKEEVQWVRALGLCHCECF